MNALLMEVAVLTLVGILAGACDRAEQNADSSHRNGDGQPAGQRTDADAVAVEAAPTSAEGQPQDPEAPTQVAATTSSTTIDVQGGSLNPNGSVANVNQGQSQVQKIDLSTAIAAKCPSLASLVEKFNGRTLTLLPIASAADLIAISSNTAYILAADIDASTITQPILPKEGILIFGDGRKISGLDIKTSTTQDISTGLISTMKCSVVSSVQFDSARVDSTNRGANSTPIFSGIIAGQAILSMVDHVQVRGGTVTGEVAGSVVGVQACSIMQAITVDSTTTIKCPAGSTGCILGGITGRAENRGGAADCGEIFERISTAASTDDNGFTGGQSGGIIGAIADSFVIRSAENRGAITGNVAGGLVGRAHLDSSSLTSGGVLTDVANFGTVTGASTFPSYFGRESELYVHSGGLIGSWVHRTGFPFAITRAITTAAGPKEGGSVAGIVSGEARLTSITGSGIFVVGPSLQPPFGRIEYQASPLLGTYQPGTGKAVFPHPNFSIIVPGTNTILPSDPLNTFPLTTLSAAAAAIEASYWGFTFGSGGTWTMGSDGLPRLGDVSR